MKKRAFLDTTLLRLAISHFQHEKLGVPLDTNEARLAKIAYSALQYHEAVDVELLTSALVITEVMANYEPGETRRRFSQFLPAAYESVLVLPYCGRCAEVFSELPRPAEVEREGQDTSRQEFKIDIGIAVSAILHECDEIWTHDADFKRILAADERVRVREIEDLRYYVNADEEHLPLFDPPS